MKARPSSSFPVSFRPTANLFRWVVLPVLSLPVLVTVRSLLNRPPAPCIPDCPTGGVALAKEATVSPLAIPRPLATEAAPFYHGYIAKVAGENISDQLADQLDEVEELFGPLNEQAALARYAPGKWSIKEILGHLTDAERIFSYRLLRISRGDRTPLPGFDEKMYVPAGHFDARPLGSL